MLYSLQRNLSWLEAFLDNLLRTFFELDVVYQYVLLAIFLYILVLGIIDFVQKVLIYIPRKIIGIIAIGIILYIAFLFFKS